MYAIADTHALRLVRAIRSGRFEGTIEWKPLSYSDIFADERAGRATRGWSSPPNLSRFGEAGAYSADKPLSVLVPLQSMRPCRRDLFGRVFGGELPGRQLLSIDSEKCVSAGPLLFLQMASFLPFPNLVLLGMELCGG